MQEIINMLEEMKKQNDTSMTNFPDIELYMDQILDYLSRQKVSLRDNEKITSAMVNNYIKEGLLPRAKGKKYNKVHMMYLCIIQRLKKVLCGKDMSRLLSSNMKDDDVAECYKGYENILSSEITLIGEYIKEQEKTPKEELAMRLAIRSQLSKMLCEHLIQELNPPTEVKSSHKKKSKTD